LTKKLLTIVIQFHDKLDISSIDSINVCWLGNNIRLVSRRLIKLALREDPLQVIDEFLLVT